MKTFLQTVKFSYPFILMVLFTLYSNPLEAQIFNKIVKQSTKAAENAVIKKTEQKVYEETSKTMDTIFEGNSKKKQENEEDKNTADEKREW